MDPATMAVVSLVLQLLDRATAAGSILGKAAAEGRPVTDAEVDAVVKADDIAAKNELAAIARRRANP